MPLSESMGGGGGLSACVTQGKYNQGVEDTRLTLKEKLKKSQPAEYQFLGKSECISYCSKYNTYSLQNNHNTRMYNKYTYFKTVHVCEETSVQQCTH